MRSARYSSLPPLMSATALAMSLVTVPVFGFGISPRGPEHAARLADRGHHVRRGDRGLEVDGALHDLLDQLLAADAGRRRPRWPRAPCRPWRRPRPAPTCRCRAASDTVPRTIWSALRGSTPRRNATSTVSSNFASGNSLERAERLGGQVAAARGRTSSAAARYRLPCCRGHASTSTPMRGPCRR